MAEAVEHGMVVCADEAARETTEALSAVRDHLEKVGALVDCVMEARRLVVAGSVNVTMEAVQVDPLLHALHRASRHLSKLRATLLLQAGVPVDVYWIDERDLTVLAEGRKTQSSLLRAQQVAKEMYDACLSRLHDAIAADSSCNSTVLDRVESCDRASAVTASALSSVINALSDFPAQTRRRVSAQNHDGEGGGTIGEGSDAQERNCHAPPSSSATDSLTPGPGTSAAEAQPRQHPARSLSTSRGSRVMRGESGNTRRRSSSRRRGVENTVSASRSYRSRAAGGRQSSVTESAELSRTRSIPSDGVSPSSAPRPIPFATTAAPTARTATESAMALGLSPVTRVGSMRRQAEATAAVEERRRLMSRSAMLGTRSTVFGRGGRLVDSPMPMMPPATTGRGEQESSSFHLSYSRRAEESLRREEDGSDPVRRADLRAESSDAADGASARMASELSRDTSEATTSEPNLREAMALPPPPSAPALSTVDPIRRINSARGVTTPASRATAAPVAMVTDESGGSDRGSSPRTITSARAVALAASVAMEGVEQVVPVATFFPSPTAASGGAEGVRAAARRGLGDAVGGRGSAQRDRHEPEARQSSGIRRHPSVNAEDSMDTQDTLDEQVAQAILDDSSLASLLSSPGRSSPRRSGGATRARRRSLVRLTTVGASGGRNGSSPPPRPPPPPPPQSIRAQEGLVMAVIGGRRSVSVGADDDLVPGGGRGGGGRLASSGSGVVDEDEVAAMRIAKQEQEAQAREDERFALVLAAREEAGVERRLHRRLHRRLRRNAANAAVAAEALGLDPAVAAAVAAGGEVSEAVRALQFQEIDENDFETLLALDDSGGSGGRTCAGKRGLSEHSMASVLEVERVQAGSRLEESCAICMADFELDEQISVLPCRHAFHDGCIRKWLALRNRCPTDMQPVVPDSPDA